MESSFTSLTTRVKADAGVRFVAYLIDAVVAYIPMLILGFINYRLSFLGILVAVGYIFTRDALPEVGGFLGGQSIGKKLMNIKVIKEDTGATILGDYGSAIIRQVSLAIPLFGIVDALMVFSAEKQRFGDKWAKTMVVKA